MVVGDTQTFSLTGVNQVKIEYGNSRVGLSAQIGQNLYIPGGYLKAFDGVSVFEQNFHIYPEKPILTESLGDGYLGEGDYQYIVVFEWIDAQGQIAQSTTSIPGLITTTAINSSVDLDISTLRYTARKAPVRTPVVVSIYRNEVGGSIFYKVTSDTDILYNDVDEDYVTFNDTLSDANLISRPLLYTTGGVLDNAPAPSTNVVRVAKNRLFVAGLENSNEIGYSKENVTDQAISFADLFRLQIDQRGGRITAISEMDEKVVFFKDSSIFYLTGDGPNDLGEGSFQITPVATDVGTSEPESVVLTPQGLMFKSSKGIWLLDRGLNTTYIGDAVQAFNDYNISSSVVVPHLNQVRFTTVEGTTLVYDHYYKTWSTFTDQPAVAALNWQDNYVFAKTDGYCWIENEVYTDNNRPIKPLIDTQWFSWAQLQGFQRVYRCLLAGEYQGPHLLQVLVYYDYIDSPMESYVYNTATGGFAESWGEDATWGDSELYGDLVGIYQFQVNFARQKCQSVRLVIKALFPDSVGNAAFTVSAVTFLVGAKGGLNRLPDSKIMQ